ncbi:MAG TPA: ATP-binding protein [Acidobacteriaceae bacterium]|nr:ATP-binding protein [Acidobacteriaceae bacterium]
MFRSRRVTVVLLAGCLCLAAILLIALNAFNLHFLNPRNSNGIFLFTAVSILVFLLFVVLLVLLCRNVLKLYADGKNRLLGSRLRTRLLSGALILSFAPTLFMFLFSYLLMNRSIDRWFSQPVAQLREDSTRVALELSQYAAENARAEAESLASSVTLDRSLQQKDILSALGVVRSHRITLTGGFVIIYDDDVPVVEYAVPRKAIGNPEIRPWMDDADTTRPAAGETLPAFVLAAARRTDQPILSAGGVDYILGTSATPSSSLVVVALPMPAGLSRTVGTIRSGAESYWELFRGRNRIRGTYFLLMLVLTVLTLFASSWLALYLAKQVTRPAETLADAMEQISAGHYSHRVTVGAPEELGEVIHSFNAMASDLEQSRALAETSTAQLSEVNRTLADRRRELELILDTIPSGVATLDRGLSVLLSNRAMLDLLDLHTNAADIEHALANLPVDVAFPPAISEEVHRLLRRSQRMRIAGSEIDFATSSGSRRLSVTLAILDQPQQERGYVLVLEDMTEVLRAQRQAAWKEVAQRVAHEIKNPLTPISLSAERIRRHVEKPTPDTPAVIRHCSDVILSSVETVRNLVDQFGALAQFPVAAPRPISLNSIVDAALLIFAGRMDDIRIERRYAADLPLVMADKDALRRALANLIDNAAEAMQGTLHRQITLITGENPGRTMAEIIVADTGPGVTSDMRERLFLPYFSTKQRGTGLGLAIASKIVQEHQGTIRVEENQPAGARFIIELPFADMTTSENVTSATAELPS